MCLCCMFAVFVFVFAAAAEEVHWLPSAGICQSIDSFSIYDSCCCCCSYPLLLLLLPTAADSDTEVRCQTASDSVHLLGLDYFTAVPACLLLYRHHRFSSSSSSAVIIARKVVETRQWCSRVSLSPVRVCPSSSVFFVSKY